MKTKIAAIGDIHFTANSRGVFNELFENISKNADVLVLCGDLTESGSMEEAELFVEELKSCSIPIISILGNHDFDKNNQKEIAKLLKNNKVIVLDGETYIFKEIGFAGIKGFCGGFDGKALAPWGEDSIKAFVQEAVDEALKLEHALVKLETKHKVILTHYSPIRKTVETENPEIIPFCGSSRLEGPINEFKADVVFHGHSHHGQLKGKTSAKIPVYNVSYPLLKRELEKPYLIYEI